MYPYYDEYYDQYYNEYYDYNRQPVGPGPGGFPPPPPMGGQFGQPSGQQGGGAPPGPPPQMVPQKSMGYSAKQPGGISIYAVDPGAIRPCRFQYVYIWLDNGQQFWAWLTFVGRNSVAGYRWIGFRWVYFAVDLRRIDSFVCY